MKKFYLCLLLTALCFNGFSQTKLDSLKKVLAKLPPEGRSFAGDTMRVRVLCEMGEVDKYKNIGIYFDESINLSKKNKWLKGEALAFNKNGIKNTINGNLYKAIDNLNQSLIISEKIKDYKLIGINFRFLGDAYLRLKAYNKAIENYDNAEKIFSKINDTYGRLISINNLSIVKKELKKYDESLILLKKCKKLNINHPNKRLFDLYINNNIADNYFFLNQLDSALNYFNTAQYQYFKVLNQNERKDYYLAVITFGKSQIYFKKNLLELSIELCNESLKYNNSNDKVLMSKIFKQLSEIYEKNKNPTKALTYHNMFRNLKDSIDNLDFDRKLALINSEYDYEKEKIKAKALSNEVDNEKKIKQNLYLLIVLICSIIIIISIYSFLIFRKNRLINEVQNELKDLNNSLELQVQNRTKELIKANEELVKKNREITDALLKGQTIERKRVATELHDNLGSTLSAIKWRLDAMDSSKLDIKEKKIYESVISMMTNAYTDVRHLSHNLIPKELEENGLIGALKKLINDLNQSEKIIFISNFQINNLKLSKNIEFEIYNICLEIINNILKHSKATKVSVQIKEDLDYHLYLQIKDNGTGFDTSIIKSGVGIGNINERVNAIKGQLELCSTPNEGTNYQIRLKYSNN